MISSSSNSNYNIIVFVQICLQLTTNDQKQDFLTNRFMDNIQSILSECIHLHTWS